MKVCRLKRCFIFEKANSQKVHIEGHSLIARLELTIFSPENWEGPTTKKVLNKYWMVHLEISIILIIIFYNLVQI